MNPTRSHNTAEKVDGVGLYVGSSNLLAVRPIGSIIAFTVLIPAATALVSLPAPGGFHLLNPAVSNRTADLGSYMHLQIVRCSLPMTNVIKVTSVFPTYRSPDVTFSSTESE